MIQKEREISADKNRIEEGWKEKGQEKHQETKGGAVKCDNTFGLLFSLPIFAFKIRRTDVIVECIAYWIKRSFARGKKSPP